MNVYKSERCRNKIHETYDQLITLWNVPVMEQTIATDYGSTHVVLCGSSNNPPLILFHGVGDDTALMWIYNAKELARDFYCIAIDTIGGPGKSVPNANYNKSFDDIRWIDQVLHALGCGMVYIAGVSNGAYLAQYYCLSRPEKVLKVICISGCIPVGESGPMKNMMKIFLPEALFPTEKNTVKLLKKLSGTNYQALTDNPVIMEHYRWLLKGFRNMAMRHHKLEHFTDKQVDFIREKALYLIGEKDPFAILGGKEMLLQYKMNVEFYKHAGHGLNHERPKEINEKIKNYLLV